MLAEPGTTTPIIIVRRANERKNRSYYTRLDYTFHRSARQWSQFEIDLFCVRRTQTSGSFRSSPRGGGERKRPDLDGSVAKRHGRFPRDERVSVSKTADTCVIQKRRHIPHHPKCVVHVFRYGNPISNALCRHIIYSHCRCARTSPLREESPGVSEGHTRTNNDLTSCRF